MQTKKKISFILNGFALFMATILISLGLLSIFKSKEVLASELNDEFNFFVATTSIKQTEVGLNGYANDLIPAYSTDTGFNFVKFEDYISASSFEDGKTYYYLLDGTYYPLVLGEGGNCFASTDFGAEPLSTFDSLNYVKINNEYKDISSGINNIFTDNNYQPYAYPLFTKNNDIYDNAEYYGNSNRIKTINKTGAYLPTNNNYYYKNALNSFSPLYNKIYSNKFSSQQEQYILLDNYSQMQNLNYGFSTNENIESLYISIGEAFNNNMKNAISSLEVHAYLENSYYSDKVNIALNDIVVEENQNNNFWFDYINLENIESIKENNTTEKIAHPEGKYTFEFNGTYKGIDGTNANNTTMFSYTYIVYLQKTSSIINYPSFNSILDETKECVNLNETDFETYFYNYQTLEAPTYTFDASKYNVSIKQDYNLTQTNYDYTYKSLKYDTPLVSASTLVAKEYGLITEANKETLIIAEEYQYDKSLWYSSEKCTENDKSLPNLKVTVYSYIYKYRTENIGTSDYFTSDWGTFDKKLTIVIREYTSKTDDKTTIFAISKYLTYEENKVDESDILKDIVEKDRIYEEEFSKNVSYSVSANADNLINLSITVTTNKDTTTISNTLKRMVFHKITNGNNLSIQAPIAYKNYSEDNPLDYIDDDNANLIGKDLDNNPYTYKDIPRSEVLDNYLFNPKQFNFNYSITLDNLGVYTIENRYVLSTVSQPTYSGNNFNEVLKTTFNKLNYLVDTNVTNEVYDFNKNYQANYLKYGFTLHNFGIKSYFNKNGKTEFKNAEDNIYSNVTEAIQSLLGENKIDTNNAKGKTINSNGSIIDNINVPITNMSPITFDYFGLYSYNGLIPKSKYYVYDFKYTDDGKIVVLDKSNPKSYYFTKDTCPSSDGYYEIVAEYNYSAFDNIKNLNNQTKFSQVFAFVIDNSSPTTTFEKLSTIIDSNTESHKEWISLGKDGYTNKAVRITWNQSSYFQYSVFPNINKEIFDGVIANTNGSANTLSFENLITAQTEKYAVGYEYFDTILKFKQLKDITETPIYQYKYQNSPLYLVPILKLTIDGNSKIIYPTDLLNSELVSEITNASDVSVEILKYVYQIYLSTDKVTLHYIDENNSQETTSSIWGNGKYQLKLEYGYKQKSYITQKFVIDNTALTGLNIKRVDLTENIKTISSENFSNNTNNLITDPFTFIYDKRPSGASIKATYTVIPFVSDNDISKILLSSNLEGITGNQLINSQSELTSLANTYSYDYSFKNSGDKVYENNIFNPSDSAIYVFNLTDTAGNTASYYVVFDKSSPNFLIDSNESEEQNFLQYGIITDLTDVYWGNYKAIKISSNNLDNAYIFGNGINLQPSNIEKNLKDIYSSQSTSKYSGLKLVRTWTINGEIKEINDTYLNADKSINFDNLYITSNNSINTYYIDEARQKQIASINNVITETYYLLIPIRNVNFSYYNTNSDDTTTYYFDYSLNNNSILEKTSTTLAPSKKSLATEKGVSTTIIENDIKHIYGFYGEKKYIYVITDLLGNECGNTLWMNLDLTLAMAYGNFELSRNTLDFDPNMNLTYLEPSSAYSPSQLYFSWIVDASTPTSQIDYKFYDFDLDFYSDYTIFNISYVNDIYTFTFINTNSDTKTVTISTKNLNNKNADGEDVSEPTSIYPFSLAPRTSYNNGWTNIIEDTETESSKFVYNSYENRYYSDILELTNDTNANYLSLAGLYVFRRVYTNYIDPVTKVVKSENIDDSISNDTVYRYYAYYIDRNGIIDLNTTTLGFVLGAGIEENYGTNITQEQIKNLATNAQDNQNNSYSTKEVSNLFASNREVIQLNLAMDKYNQSLSYKNFISNNTYIIKDAATNLNNWNIDYSNPEDKILYLINRYIYGINEKTLSSNFNANTYYNEKFLLNLSFSLGKNTILIGTNENKSNTISPSDISSGTTPYLLNSLSNRPTYAQKGISRNSLTDGILLTTYSNNTYSAIITDCTGVKHGSDMKSWNKEVNSLSLDFKITRSYPSAELFGKYYSDENPSTENFDEYRTSLFDSLTSSLTTSRLQNLNEGTSTEENNYTVWKDTNNKTLIFAFEKTAQIQNAEINPYEITITRKLPNSQTETIFNLTVTNNSKVFSSSVGYSQERLKNSFFENDAKNMWAVVIFDNYDKNHCGNKGLSDGQLDATYTMSVQYKGLESDYRNGYFKKVYLINEDNTKPLYNIIKLMENDKYITQSHSLSLPSGYTNIDNYLETLQGLSGLEIQASLENIYNYYIESYYSITNNNIDYYKTVSNEFYLTPSGEKIPKTLLENYFFAIETNYTPYNLSNEVLSKAMDTSKVYYREISDPSNYKFTLTSDDFPTANRKNQVSELALNSIFNSSILGENQFKSVTNNGFEVGKYYEFVEIDSAGNYRVYATYCTKALEISYEYNLVENSTNTEDTHGLFNSKNKTEAVDINGTDLKFKNKSNDVNTYTFPDIYLKAEIYVTYSASAIQNSTNRTNFRSTMPLIITLDVLKQKIYFTANGNPYSMDDKDLSEIQKSKYIDEFLQYITELYNKITEDRVGISDFNFDIKIINRVGYDFNIKYNYPGEELKYIKDGYKITIPNDSDYRSTKIVEMEVSKYSDSIWKILTLDDDGKQIPEGRWKSLGGKSITLKNGTYKIKLTDNYGRCSIYYETWNASSVNYSITYSGATQVINSNTYTAKTTTVIYDPSVYIPVVIVTDENDNKTFYSRFNTNISSDIYTITASSIIEAQKITSKLIFEQQTNHWTKFDVILFNIANLTNIDFNSYNLSDFEIWYNNNKDDVANKTYSFILYTKLPKIQLKNLNGGIISTNTNQIYIEDLYVTWSEKYNNKTLDFNSKLLLKRTYEGKVYNSTIISSPYKITLPGDYKITLTNNLGYESSPILFTRSSGETMLYSVYTYNKTNGESNQLIESSYTTEYSGKIMYHYFALEQFNNFKASSAGVPDTEFDHIEIITNTNNKINYKYVSSDTSSIIYQIYSEVENSNSIIFRYIQIHFISESNNNFANLSITYLDGETQTNVAITSSNITSTQKELYLFFNKTENYESLYGYNQVIGNTISIKHYYNGLLVDDIDINSLQQYKTTGSYYGLYYLTIKSGGIHKFVISDLAGNIAKFNGVGRLNISLINSLVFNVNDEEPVNGQIYNDAVIFKILTELDGYKLYNTFNISVYRNSEEITPEAYGLNTYRFTQSGYYIVRLSSEIQLDATLQKETIVSEYSFKIVNPKTTLQTFDISSGNNFKIISVKKKIDRSEDVAFVEIPFSSLNQLWLSALDEASGSGFYEITLQSYIDSIKQYRTFSFNVWLSSTTPIIVSSIEYGTSTTDPITLSYNAKSIYESIGESSIVINNEVIATINENSENNTYNITINEAGDYWIEIITADNKLVASYKVTKNEPLNSTAKLIIIIVSCVVVALIIIFIIIRRKTRFK